MVWEGWIGKRIEGDSNPSHSASGDVSACPSWQSPSWKCYCAEQYQTQRSQRKFKQQFYKAYEKPLILLWSLPQQFF